MDTNNSLVGKVFYFTAGYSMTLATFLKVIKETEKQVTFVEVGQTRSGGGCGAEYAMATPDLHVLDNDKKEKTYKGIKQIGYIKGTFGSHSTQWAHEWNGKPVSINTWD